jgi:GNAT superfamily N-acetyltransferase
MDPKEIKVRRTNTTPDEKFRHECLLRRPYAQESYLESLAREAELIELECDGAKCGYALVRDSCIVEFFVYPTSPVDETAVLESVVSLTGAEAALCQSFDSVMTDACSSLGWESKTVAHLFRSFNNSVIDVGLEAQLATIDCLSVVKAVHDGFFDSEDEIRSYLDEEHARLFLYYRDSQAVSCGIIKRVVACRNSYDIGMVVAPAYRGTGYGAAVVSHLKHFCLAQGWQPVAGCSVDNVASKRSLERAGFTSEHQLIRYAQKL